MEVIRLHYQRRGFDFLKKHSSARNLSSSVSTWEGWDEVSDCHSSLCSWCMSQEAQKSTAAVSSFFFLRGGSLTLSSVSSEAPKALSWVRVLLLRRRMSVAFSRRETWCPSYTGSIVGWQCIVLKITNRPFRYVSSYLWNKLPASFRQPNPDHSFSHFSQPNSLGWSVSSSPLSLSITPTLFHYKLKRYIFLKSFPP